MSLDNDDDEVSQLQQMRNVFNTLRDNKAVKALVEQGFIKSTRENKQTNEPTKKVVGGIGVVDCLPYYNKLAADKIFRR